MAFPETPLPLEVDLCLDGSTWTDITSDVRAEQQVQITRGRSDWGQQVDYGRCTLTLENEDGRYSPRNPSGLYYGQIGRNTPLRVSVNTGSVALDLPGSTGDYASTPDATALDITGDIDIRIDATLNNWIQPDYPSQGQTDYQRTKLIAKEDGDGTSWALYTRAGRPYFEWFDSGGIGSWVWGTDLPLTPSGRLALRVTLDVDNGSGGFDVTFYTADTIDGPWTALDIGTGSGTTSIQTTTASLKIGDATDETTFEPALGRVHAAQVYSGIGGTLVASPDFTAQASGATSFTDAAGRTWSLSGNAEITNRKVRFVGEVASWTPQWDTGGFDPTVAVEAAGVMRRLGVGKVPTKSAMYREFTSSGRMSAGIFAYWPMEDGADATKLATAFAGQQSATVTQPVTLASYSDWVASDPIPTITTGALKAPVPAYTASAGTSTMVGVFIKVPVAGVSSTQRLFSCSLTGQLATLSVWANTAGNIAVRGYDGDGTQVHDSGFGTDAINGLEKFFVLEYHQSSTSTVYTLTVADIASSMLTAIPDNDVQAFTIGANTITSYTPGNVTTIRIGQDAGLNGTAIGHLAVGTSGSAFSASIGAVVGWNAEQAASRTARLGIEEKVRSYPTGGGDEQCGPQPRDTALNIMRAAGDVDSGILAEQRTILGLRYVTRASMYNQPAAFTLNYTGGDGLVAPLEPTDDDQSVTNDVTVQRTNGASARRTLDTGTLSTQDPPDGVGLYDTSTTLNLLDDTQPSNHAGWLLHLGTWDEQRYPVVRVNLANAPGSIENAAAVDVGSHIQITNPPSWLPPGPIDLQVQGYSETLDQYTWTLAYNCSPNGPWNVAYADDTTYGRADTDGSQLAAAMTSAATTATVQTTSGPVWTTDAGEVPFDVLVAGEQMTVTACASWLKDAFGRTASSGWGSADSGQAWSTSGGSSTDYAVGSGYGSHTLASVNVSRRCQVTFGYTDFDYYASVTTSATATGASIFGGPIGRYVDSNNYYQARIEFTTGNAIKLAILSRVSGTETVLATYTTALTHVAGTFVRVRFQASGTALQARIWPAAGVEPALWQVQATDSSLTSSPLLGVRSIAGTGNTNTSPQVRYDDVQVVNPQTFTVTRSVNGVVKSQASGADVRLANPAYLAL